MIIVTGGAGFIGSAIIWKLNQWGQKNILIVDRLRKTEKWKNLVNLAYQDYLEVEEFLSLLQSDRFATIYGPLQAIFHMGACSSTTELDAGYLVNNNFEFSKIMARLALKENCRLIYASSAATYGDGEQGYDDDPDKIHLLKPLNMYGYSKQMFDQWILTHGKDLNYVGIKFFNAYGPNEYHKGDMRSLIHKAVPQIQKSGKIRLFKSHKEGFADGQQLRDFIYIKDVVDVCRFLLKSDYQGILNLGTGKPRSFVDLANSVFGSMEKEINIEFFPMPEGLREKYQYYTCANIAKLKGIGYKKDFYSLEDGIADYVTNYILNQKDPYLGNEKPEEKVNK
ncbi:ADP-glyceromanno-heptose 6-epimerase [Candidatus Riflebacteria bacterium]